MPFSQPTQLPGLASNIADLSRRLQALEAKCRVLQSSAITIVDGNFNTVGLVGTLADGMAGISLSDTAGNILVQLDSNGLHVYNASGTEEVALGLLNSSPAQYGLAVLPAVPGATTLQRVGGAVTAVTTADQTTTVTSPTWTNLSGDPSLTVQIGPSGSALIYIAADIATGGVTAQAMLGRLGLQVDGGSTPPTGFPTVSASTGGPGGIDVSLNAQSVITGLSVGSHAFSLLYSTENTASGGNVGFSNRIIQVQPL